MTDWPNLYECPPFDDPSKCKFDPQFKRCTKPNRWTEWLLMNKGQGKSIQQLSREYREFKDQRPEYAIRKIMCNSVRARGKSHEQDVIKIGDPVAYYVGQSRIAPASLYSTRRELILKYLRKTWNFRNQFSVKKFNKSKLRKVFKAIDLFYFDNSLFKLWRRSKKIRILYKIIEEDTTEVMRTTSYFDGNKNVHTIMFFMNKKKFQTHENTVDKVPVTSRLEFLLLNCQHELAHALISVYRPEQGPGDDKGHTVLWNLLVNRIFGHSENSHGCCNIDP